MSLPPRLHIEDVGEVITDLGRLSRRLASMSDVLQTALLADSIYDRAAAAHANDSTAAGEAQGGREGDPMGAEDQTAEGPDDVEGPCAACGIIHRSDVLEFRRFSLAAVAAAASEL